MNESHNIIKLMLHNFSEVKKKKNLYDANQTLFRLRSETTIVNWHHDAVYINLLQTPNTQLVFSIICVQLFFYVMSEASSAIIL